MFSSFHSLNLIQNHSLRSSDNVEQKKPTEAIFKDFEHKHNTAQHITGMPTTKHTIREKLKMIKFSVMGGGGGREARSVGDAPTYNDIEDIEEENQTIDENPQPIFCSRADIEHCYFGGRAQISNSFVQSSNGKHRSVKRSKSNVNCKSKYSLRTDQRGGSS